VLLLEPLNLGLCGFEFGSQLVALVAPVIRVHPALLEVAAHTGESVLCGHRLPLRLLVSVWTSASLASVCSVIWRLVASRSRAVSVTNRQIASSIGWRFTGGCC